MISTRMDSIEEMGILGVIPARGGSKGIPRKNLLSIGGKNLIERAIASSEESELLTHTVVSTEDEEMLEVAKEAGGGCSISPSGASGDGYGVVNGCRATCSRNGR
jgi:CMP-2-keto-3-deoxyoctulosonic acid synthetase